MSEPSPASMRLASPPDYRVALPSPEERDKRAKELLDKKIRGLRFEKLLGHGPLTSTFQATYEEGERRGERVVVRLLHATGGDALKSFVLRAAYAANRFRHPRVIAVVQDGATPEGETFIVKDATDAEPLSAVIAKSGVLPPDKALRVAEQALDAVEIAHSHGVLHGALKPENILITSRESIRLVDFSLPPGASSSENALIEHLADMRVDPCLAPERCEGAIPHESSDVYAVGACLYFALSGKYPRGDAKTRKELADATYVPIERAAVNVAGDLTSVLAFALARDPAQRYETAYAMLGDVRRVLAGRRPKLREAAAPVPSGSYREFAPGSSTGMSLAPPAPLTSPSLRQEKSQVRGNFFLIFAIALLVFAATFAVVRARREMLQDGNAPATEPPEHSPDR